MRGRDPDRYLDQLVSLSDPARAVEMARYHKAERRYLGLANPQVDTRIKLWRKELSVAERVDLAADLWRTDIFEARLAAAKLLTQGRMNPDDAVWQLIQSWVSDFDSWAIADHACMAGQKRLLADPARLDDVTAWTMSNHMWRRRAALVITLPWARLRYAEPDDIARRERVLTWAAGYVADDEWFIQKAVAWWLRDLSKRDPARVTAFLDAHGDAMKPFARKEAAKYLT